MITIDKRQLQLVGITSMFLASKYEEIFPPCITDFIFVTADAYTSRQVRDMELNILLSLDYRINKPFSLQFLRRYSRITNSTVIEHSMAKFILEKAMMDDNLVSIRPSLRAASALVLAQQILNSKRCRESLKFLVKYTNFTDNELIEVKSKLKVNLTAPPLKITKVDSVVQKYSSKVFMEVARHAGTKLTAKRLGK